MPAFSASQLSNTLMFGTFFMILIAALLCGLLRKRHKLVPALILVAVALVSAVIAAVICRFQIKPISRMILDHLSDSLYGDPRLDLLALMPTGQAGLTAMMGLGVAFVLFVPVFLLVYLVCRIITGVVLRACGIRRDKENHVGSFFVGMGNGVILVAILLIPLYCSMSMLSGTMQTFLDTGAGDTTTVQESFSASDMENIQVITAALSENDILQFADTVAGKPIAAIIGHTTIKVPADGNQTDRGADTVHIDLAKDINDLAEVAGYGLIAVDQFKTLKDTRTLTTAQLESVDRVADVLFRSELFTRITAELLRAASNELKGEDMRTSLLPDATYNELLTPLIKAAVEVLSTETADDLKNDVHTVTDVLSRLTDIPFGNSSYDTVMQKVWRDGLYSEIIAIIGANEHMAPLSRALDEVGFRVVSLAIGRDKLESGYYDASLSELSSTLQTLLTQSPAEREATVRAAVQDAFDQYDIQVPDEIAVSLAEEVITTAGADGEITSDELVDFLMSHYDTVGAYVPEK